METSKISVQKATSLLTTYTDKEGNITDLIAYKTYEKNLAIKDTLAAPNLITLTKQLGEANLVKRLFSIIAEGIAPFKVTNPMTERDIISAVFDILSQFGTDTPEDLILCLRSARMGLYGKIYNRVDGPIIIDWLRQHLGAKYEAKEEKLKNDKNSRDEIEGTEDPRALAMLSKIRQGLEAKTNAAKPPDSNTRETLEGWLEAIESRANKMSLDELKAVKRQLINSNVTGAVTNEIARIDKLIANAKGI